MIVEDQTAIRQMLVAFVAAMPDFEVVGEAATVEEALEVAAARRPSVVVLDWMLLGGIGLSFLQAVRLDPPPAVLVFSANTTESAVREALAAGARGYIEKTVSFSEFTTALRAVAAGQTALGPESARALRDGNATRTELSPSERGILRMLASGLSNKEMAARLGRSVRTVENHRARIIKRTGLHSVAQLTLLAIELGLLDPANRDNAQPASRS